MIDDDDNDDDDDDTVTVLMKFKNLYVLLRMVIILAKMQHLTVYF